MQTAILQAFERANQAASAVRGTTSPNPPVGAVLLHPETFEIVGVGATQPVGGPHAEVMALRAAGAAAHGAIAVVTLEPCNHQGRTGPCSHALAEAGISALYYANDDPAPSVHGGAEYLREHGVEVERVAVATPELEPWLGAMHVQRPYVTAKFAQTLDGFTAAVDGSSQWITGPEARAWVHRDRAQRDAIIIGTGTALADDPALTARYPDGSLYPSQPRAVVVGKRSLDGQAPALHARGFSQYPSVEEALSALWREGARDVLVEGGATLLGSFFRAGLVDAVQAYLAPLLLGDGRSVIGGGLAHTLGEGLRYQRRTVRELGPDVLLELDNRNLAVEKED